MLAVLAVTTALAACSGGSGSPPPSPVAPASPASSTTPSAAPGALSWTGCGGGFSCATLQVPLGSGTAGTTPLALTRHLASGARVGSLLVNPGGPGASAVDSLQRSITGLPAVLAERFDLVAFDPRGVGHSSPVRCGSTADLDRYWALDPSPDTPAELAAYQQGTAGLVAGCAQGAGDLLAHLSTADAAADMERVRVALGDEPLNYLGYSYGTALGVAYLEAHPTSVRTMVLDGALDPTLTWDALLTEQSRSFDAALAALLADCEKTRCAFRRAVTGDLGAAFDELAARVERTPLPAAGGRTVGPGELTLGVGEGLYDRGSGWPAVQAALATAQHGDGRALLALSDGYLGRTQEGYDPLTEANIAVNCVDRPWPRSPQAYVDLAARLTQTAPRFGPANVFEALPCATWPALPTSTPHPVRAPGAPPVVVVGTTGDPATPYAWAVGLASQLPQGVLLTHVGEGHTAFRAGAADCLVDPVDAYLVDGRAPAPARC